MKQIIFLFAVSALLPLPTSGQGTDEIVHCIQHTRRVDHRGQIREGDELTPEEVSVFTTTRRGCKNSEAFKRQYGSYTSFYRHFRKVGGIVLTYDHLSNIEAFKNTITNQVETIQARVDSVQSDIIRELQNLEQREASAVGVPELQKRIDSIERTIRELQRSLSLLENTN